jgi:hypothetical protein
VKAGEGVWGLIAICLKAAIDDIGGEIHAERYTEEAGLLG